MCKLNYTHSPKINNMNKQYQELSLGSIFAKNKPVLLKAWAFSVIANLLSLTPAIYMLQVYDRVINSRSLTTLLMLTIVTIGAYLLMELLEWVRSDIFKSVAINYEKLHLKRLFDLIFQAQLRKINTWGSRPINDLRTLREFFYSPSLLAFIELPLVPIYLFLIFLIHPMLFYFAVIGAAIQILITLMTEINTHPTLTTANQAAAAAQQYANASLRNGQVVESMGMIHDIHKKWMQYQFKFLNHQAIASDYAATLGVGSKMLQQVISSGMLGLGCWLFIKGDLGDGGMLIVGSILGGKALQPLVVLLTNWRHIISARDSYQRLREVLSSISAELESMPLPAPKGKLNVENLTAGAPGSNLPILKNISFALDPGECMAIVGPSAAGKTTLVRILMGLWPAMNGKARLDGVDLYQWNKNELGPYLGYLPQNVELFDGTIAENISRFDEPDLPALNKTVQLVGIQNFIAELPLGLDHPIGNDGAFLSGGLRQRIGLARAVYRTPKFVVLDEPNANLDEAGDQALLETIASLKAAGSTIVVVTHRPQVLNIVDKMLILVDGTVQVFGKKDEVLEMIQKSTQQKQF